VCVYGGGWGGEEKARQREKGFLSCHFQKKSKLQALIAQFLKMHTYVQVRNACVFACVQDIHTCTYAVRAHLHVCMIYIRVHTEFVRVCMCI